MIRIALALAIALPATAAAAQSNRKPTWDDLLKPLDVKTDPRVPVAPPVDEGTRKGKEIAEFINEHCRQISYTAYAYQECRQALYEQEMMKITKELDRIKDDLMTR